MTQGPTHEDQEDRLEDAEDLFPPPRLAEDGPLGDLLEKPHEPLPLTKRMVLLAAGVVLLGIGTVVWILPVVFGAPIFWLAGLMCLAQASDRTRRAINSTDRRLPKRVRRALRWARDKAHMRATSRQTGQNGPAASPADPMP